MNHANEAALTKAIVQVLASPEGWRAMAEPGAMAAELARRGALMPSALTDRNTDFLVLGIDHGRNILPEGPDMGKPVRDVSATG